MQLKAKCGGTDKQCKKSQAKSQQAKDEAMAAQSIADQCAQDLVDMENHLQQQIKENNLKKEELRSTLSQSETLHTKVKEILLKRELWL